MNNSIDSSSVSDDATTPRKKGEQIIITPEMKQEFWLHDLNPITGLPTIKEVSNVRFGEEYSTKGDGVRYADSAGYQSIR